jgi:hypothetical protein
MTKFDFTEQLVTQILNANNRGVNFKIDQYLDDQGTSNLVSQA